MGVMGEGAGGVQMEQGCVSPLVPAETFRFYLSYALESLTILFEERATH